MKIKVLEKLRRVTAVCAALIVLSASLSAVFAADTASTKYDSNVLGSLTTTFDKNLVIENGVNIPAAKSYFTVSYGAPLNAPDENYLEVYAGINPNKVLVNGKTNAQGGCVEYKAQHVDDAANTAAGDYVTIIANSPDEEHYTARKSVTLDFSEVGFDHPGVYRYVITESGATPGIVNDSNAIRTVDVYVVNEDAPGTANPRLRVAGYEMYSGAVNTCPGKNSMPEDAEKLNSYTNSYLACNLTLAKELDGNQADRSEYFEFTINLTGSKVDAVYEIDLSGTDTTAGNPDSVTIGKDGSGSVTVRLQGGQSVTINGISANTKYTITEDNPDEVFKEGYVVSAEAEGEDVVDAVFTSKNKLGRREYKIADTVTGITKNTTVTFTNTKNTDIPTGIVMKVVPVIIAAAVIIILIAVIVIRSKKHDDDDDE